MSTFNRCTSNCALYEQPTEWLSYFSHNWSIWQTCIHLQIKVTGHSFHLNYIYSQWGTNKWSIQWDKDFTFLEICPRFYQPCKHCRNSNVGSSHLNYTLKLNVHWHIAADLNISYRNGQEKEGKFPVIISSLLLFIRITL